MKTAVIALMRGVSMEVQTQMYVSASLVVFQSNLDGGVSDGMDNLRNIDVIPENLYIGCRETPLFQLLFIMVNECTCQNLCSYVVMKRRDPYYTDNFLFFSACGPQGTGCACPKGKCNCAECPNKAHTAKVR
jgi:hypothetical protein